MKSEGWIRLKCGACRRVLHEVRGEVERFGLPNLDRSPRRKAELWMGADGEVAFIDGIARPTSNPQIGREMTGSELPWDQFRTTCHRKCGAAWTFTIDELRSATRVALEARAGELMFGCDLGQLTGPVP